MKTSIIMASGMAIGIGMILWWWLIEHQILVPSALKPIKEGISILLNTEFKTGDLLFFRGLSWAEKAIQTYTKNRYNHVAMIIAEKGKKFLWEADVGEGYRQGPRIIPLETKLKGWGGTTEIAVRFSKSKASRKKILAFAKDKLDKPFDKSMLRWMFYWWPRDSETYFCSELIAKTLQILGLLPKGKRASAYSPKDLAKMSLSGYQELKVLRK